MRVEVPEREAGGERHAADLPLEMDVEGEVRDTQVVDALLVLRQPYRGPTPYASFRACPGGGPTTAADAAANVVK